MDALRSGGTYGVSQYQGTPLLGGVGAAGAAGASAPATAAPAAPEDGVSVSAEAAQPEAANPNIGALMASLAPQAPSAPVPPQAQIQGLEPGAQSPVGAPGASNGFVMTSPVPQFA